MSQAPNPFTQAASQGYGDFTSTLDDEDQDEDNIVDEQQQEQQLEDDEELEGPQSPEPEENEINELGFTQTQERSYPTGIESPDEDENEEQNGISDNEQEQEDDNEEAGPKSPPADDSNEQHEVEEEEEEEKNDDEDHDTTKKQQSQSQQRRRVQIMDDSDNEEERTESTNVVSKEKNRNFLKQFTMKNDDSHKKHKKRHSDEHHHRHDNKSKRFRKASNDDDDNNTEEPQQKTADIVEATTSPIVRGLLSSNYLPILFLKIIVAIALIFVLILFIYCCYRHRKNKNHLSSSSIALSPRIKTCLVNPTQSSPYHSPIIIKRSHHQVRSLSSSPITNTKLTNLHYRQTSLQPESNYQQTYLPFGGNVLYEVPFTNVRFLQEIGQGEFGQIYIGELIDSKSQCIVKTLENEHAKQEYLREIEIFRHIHHINISCLIGICIPTQYTYSLMIYEYLNHGNLHDYLTEQHSETINLTDFLFISIQIVSGMIYLSEKKFLHNDLSAKNIFLCEHLNIKITNIGRYQQKYHLDYYNIANHLLPVRWMSIESLLSGIYSEKSDVWSFGVLLWEMFSYGTQPYYGYTNPEVIEMIRDRILLACPLNCSKKIYALMCSCWEDNSEQRPTFIELMQRLTQLQDKTTLLPIDDELIPLKRLESFREKYRTSILSTNE
ncbi:unnamed protein product [Rotaria sp. Silwood2]|nr:unnamed protein product [Rotaria sp. Silwood2]